MNRNCLFNKAIALLLCAFMLIGFLPSTVFSAAADEFVKDENESDPDIWEGTTEEEAPVGSEENPEEISESATATLAEKSEGYYYVYKNDASGTLNINFSAGGAYGYKFTVSENGEVKASGCDTNNYGYNNTLEEWPATNVYGYEYKAGTELIIWVNTYNVATIETTNAEDGTVVSTDYEEQYPEGSVTVTVEFTYPEGTKQNPIPLYPGIEDSFDVSAGVEKWFSFQTSNNGYLTVDVTSDNNAACEITCVTSEATTQVDAVKNVKYTDGETYYFAVTAETDGKVSFDVAFVVGWGTEESPFMLQDLNNTVTIPAGTSYFQGYFSNMNMTVTGEGNLVYNGESAEIDGEPILVSSANPRMPVTFSIENESGADATYNIVFSYPLGNSMNPDELELGDNAVTTIAGDGQGYYVYYVAEQTGTLNITFSSDSVYMYTYDWTPYTSTDADFSNVLTLEVTEGQQIDFSVAGEPWDYPETDININLAYEVLEAPEAPAELKFATRNFVLQSSLAVNFKANAALFAEGVYENPYAVFTIGDRTETITEYTIEEGTGRYVFTFAGITPGQMHRTISVTIYAYHQGFLYEGKTHTVSVRDYATSQLSKETSKTEWATLLVDMLNYGAAAQEYLESLGGDAGAPEDLANKDLTTDQAAWATQSIEDTTNIRSYTGLEADTEAATWKSMRLVLESGVAMSFKVATDDVSKIYLKAYNPDGDKTWIIDTYATDNGDGTYWFNFSGMNADQFRQEVEFTFCNENGEAVSRTLHWSISSYSAGKLNEDSALNKMVYAMMKYGDACYAYKY